MIQFKPDWVAVWTAEKAEAELSGSGFKFKGPGWYENNGDYLLAIPVDRPAEKMWHQKWKKDELFEFNIYNQRNPTDAFNLIINAPEREKVP